jgi:hypothetical protein
MAIAQQNPGEIRIPCSRRVRKDFAMADHLPITASGPRSPQQRPRPIPPKVRVAIALLVRGRDDDENCAPLDFVTAAREAGITPPVFRKHLDRPEVRSLLLRERRVFRDALCASNEAALARIRNTSRNGMSVVASIRCLENLAEADRNEAAARPRSPGFVIVVGGSPLRIGPLPPPTVDVTAQAAGDERPDDEGSPY